MVQLINQNSDESSKSHANRFECSQISVGDKHGYRAHTQDHFKEFDLSMIRIDQTGDSWMNDYLQKLHPQLNQLSGFVWVPPLVDPEFGESKIVKVIRTGGRTYRLPSELTGRIFLDLASLGWSDGNVSQEFFPEIKGGGTLLENAGLSIPKLKSVAKELAEQGSPSLETSLKKVLSRFHEGSEYLGMSAKIDLGRPKGSQFKKYSEHSREVTTILLNNFPVKFTPLLYMAELPVRVMERISILNKALNADEELFNAKKYTQEIRLTPSDVRAIYFDKAKNDSELIRLCSNVSRDPQILEAVIKHMIPDSAKYMELLASHTYRNDKGEYCWVKTGDIHLAWYKFDAPDCWDDTEASDYCNNKPFAWYLAKDITVAPTGFWFTDLEGIGAGTELEKSAELFDLRRKQRIYALCVLRDFHRVITQFRIGCQMYAGQQVSQSQKKDIQENTIDQMVVEMNQSGSVTVERKKGSFHVNVLYSQMKGVEPLFKIPEKNIMRRY